MDPANFCPVRVELEEVYQIFSFCVTSHGASCSRLDHAAAEGIVRSAAAEFGVYALQLRAVSGAFPQQLPDADHFGVKEDASVVYHPLLLPQEASKQQYVYKEQGELTEAGDVHLAYTGNSCAAEIDLRTCITAC